jgi:hypothetical protein
MMRCVIGALEAPRMSQIEALVLSIGMILLGIAAASAATL